MLVFSYGFRAPVQVIDSNSLKAAINSATGNIITLCEKASLERDEGAGREYYDFSYPQLMIEKHFGGYTVAFYKEWNDERVASGGEKLKKPLMLECAEQFMELLSAPDFERDEKLPSCVEWE